MLTIKQCQSKATKNLILVDMCAAIVAWLLFYLYRKIEIEPWVPSARLLEKDFSLLHLWDLVGDVKLGIGLLTTLLFWYILHFLTGYYNTPYKHSRVEVLGYTLLTSLIGSVAIFFGLVIDDVISSYTNYYSLLGWLLVLYFVCFSIGRIGITSYHIRQLADNKVYSPSIIIGSGSKALELYEDIKKSNDGTVVMGYVSILEEKDKRMPEAVPYIGGTEEINTILQQSAIEKVMLAPEYDEYEALKEILIQLRYHNIQVVSIMENRDILTGKALSNNILNIPLLEIFPDTISQWQKSAKRCFDVSIAIIGIIILLPVYIIVAAMVVMGSPGGIFYTQERIGLQGIPFRIIKFRSMYSNAEQKGPALSSDNDPRITPFGRFMRKTRLDEIPQFWNVLKGDMSIVGPRPERQFYIDQIIQKAPHYRLTMRIRPGITSWGQVKYGYAENVDEMIQRLRYDILYVENMSLGLDIRIIIHTIIVVLKAKGK